MSSAITEFGEMLERSVYYSTTGKGPTFGLTRSGDIVIMAAAPKNPDGLVCSVKVKGDPVSHYCRVHVNGDRINLGYMDSYDIWKTVPAADVTIGYEVMGTFHKYGKMEPLRGEKSWEKRALRAFKKWARKFTITEAEQLLRHDIGTYDTLFTALCLGYEKGRKDALNEQKRA